MAKFWNFGILEENFNDIRVEKAALRPEYHANANKPTQQHLFSVRLPPSLPLSLSLSLSLSPSVPLPPPSPPPSLFLSVFLPRLSPLINVYLDFLILHPYFPL